MHDSLTDDLQPVVVRWTMGGLAASLAPEALSGHLGDDPDEAELRLLVLAGQALGTMVVPEPSGTLQGIPDLPVLALPTLPDGLRPLTAPILALRDEWLRLGLLRLLEARGHVVHPADWMPGARDAVPDVYAPWQDWANGIQTTAGADRPVWDDLGPSARLSMLTSLRRSDPAAALDAIRSHVTGEPPERRLAMVRTMAIRLEERDRAFLEGLSADRAPTVRAEAVRLLARLGGGDQARTPDDIADLVSVTEKGLIRRERVISLKARMNHAQQARLEKVMAGTDAAAFAATLGLADVDLAGMWPWGQDAVFDQRFADLLTGTGSDGVMASLERAIADGATISVATLREGVGRLSAQAAADIVRSSCRTGDSLTTVVTYAPVLGVVEDVEKNAEWRSTYLTMLRDDDVHASVGLLTMRAVGLLVTRDTARSILDRLAQTSLRPGDPRLDTLRINAAL